MGRIREETFNDVRARHAREAAKRHRLTSAQASQLVASMPFSQTRIELAQELRASTLDPEAYAVVLDALRFESEREVVSRWLSSLQAASPALSAPAPKKPRQRR